MHTWASESNRGVRGLLILAVILAAGRVFAQNGPVLMRQQPASEEVQARAILDYWTPQRMREARPKPFPEVLVAGSEGESSLAAELPSDASVGYAPGWRPGLGPQPGAEARLEITPDDPLYEILLGGEQPQVSPPFGPPGFPADYGNYAPFNRFTWNQGNTLVYPVSVVGKLFFTQRGQNFVCSASVIHRDTLATAGHCVHDGSNNPAGWSTNVLFCPSLNPGGSPRGCWAGVSLATSFQWFTAGNIDRDYGCIVTRNTGTTIANSVGNVTGWLGRAWNWPSRQSTFAWGYPAAAPFPGNRLITVASTEWYQLNRNAAEAQLSKYIGSDMTGGSSGGPWWFNMTHSNVEFADTDGSNLTDPFQGGGSPLINGVNSHKRCSQAGCPAGSIFTQEMGSPQFRSTAGDINESEDVFAVCFANGGT
jgi:V8-like Glu-specific endopeptidase